MKVRPLGDRILVKRLDDQVQKVGSIIIPDTAKEKPQEGEVISVGTGARNDKGEKIVLEVKAGDKILFGKYSGTEVEVEGEKLLILSKDDILAIVE